MVKCINPESKKYQSHHCNICNACFVLYHSWYGYEDFIPSSESSQYCPHCGNRKWLYRLRTWWLSFKAKRLFEKKVKPLLEARYNKQEPQLVNLPGDLQ